MRDLKIAGAEIELREDGVTITRYPDAPPLRAYPQDHVDYRARAVALGYGDDAGLMSREHELAHHLLAEWLGQPHSPTLHAVAAPNGPDEAGRFYRHWQVEEAAVLAVQAFARTLGVSLEQRARELRPPGDAARLTNLLTRALPMLEAADDRKPGGLIAAYRLIGEIKDALHG